MYWFSKYFKDTKFKFLNVLFAPYLHSRFRYVKRQQSLAKGGLMSEGSSTLVQFSKEMCQILTLSRIFEYRKVANSSLSQLVAHFQIFRRLMKGKFDAYVLFQNWIVDQSTAHDFMVYFLLKRMMFFHLPSIWCCDHYITKNCIFCWYTTAEWWKLDFFNHWTMKKIIWRCNFQWISRTMC